MVKSPTSAYKWGHQHLQGSSQCFVLIKQSDSPCPYQSRGYGSILRRHTCLWKESHSSVKYLQKKLDKYSIIVKKPTVKTLLMHPYKSISFFTYYSHFPKTVQFSKRLADNMSYTYHGILLRKIHKPLKVNPFKFFLWKRYFLLYLLYLE